MEFEITHVTSYAYEHPAAEAYLETRLTPPNSPNQTVLQRTLTIEPATPTSAYTDYFGNGTEFFSLPWRHRALEVKNELLVRTHPKAVSDAGLAVAIDEARQIFASAPELNYDYLQATNSVGRHREAHQWARKYLVGSSLLADALPRLNHAVYEYFTYESGSTENSTPIEVVWKQRRGVCQDFTHIMLSILRTAGLPARYVCGYIETDPPMPRTGESRRRLVGSIATHAWVEVLLPGLTWVGLDPTNDKYCDDRHVAVSHGRDYSDATPIRGTFKGAGRQKMKVRIVMRRRNRTEPAVAAAAPSIG